MSTRFDTIIRGGTVATAADTFACDVGIRDGKITALGDDLGAAATIIDATGRLVLPGGIDSHVHFAQPSGDGIVMADGFATGTRSAAFGGNTTVLPFCLQEKGQTLREALKRLSRAGGGRMPRRRRLPPHHLRSDRAGAGSGTAGAGGGRLHLAQGVHDL